jgi:hypothetical protein
MPVKHATRLVPSEHSMPIQRVPLVPPCARLSDTMTPTALVRALERLPFVGPECVLRMDRGVRDYLVRALKER